MLRTTGRNPDVWHDAAACVPALLASEPRLPWELNGQQTRT
jgi:hypothetical protein